MVQPQDSINVEHYALSDTACNLFHKHTASGVCPAPIFKRMSVVMLLARQYFLKTDIRGDSCNKNRNLSILGRYDTHYATIRHLKTGVEQLPKRRRASSTAGTTDNAQYSICNSISQFDPLGVLYAQRKKSFDVNEADHLVHCSSSFVCMGVHTRLSRTTAG